MSEQMDLFQDLPTEYKTEVMVMFAVMTTSQLDAQIAVGKVLKRANLQDFRVVNLAYKGRQ